MAPPSRWRSAVRATAAIICVVICVFGVSSIISRVLWWVSVIKHGSIPWAVWRRVVVVSAHRRVGHRLEITVARMWGRMDRRRIMWWWIMWRRIVRHGWERARFWKIEYCRNWLPSTFNTRARCLYGGGTPFARVSIWCPEMLRSNTTTCWKWNDGELVRDTSVIIAVGYEFYHKQQIIVDKSRK